MICVSEFFENSDPFSSKENGAASDPRGTLP